jgi:FMN-dependent NADH-azoreductase
MKILHVDSSISLEASVSRRLSRAIVDRLRALHPDAEVVSRDLAADPLPYFDAASLAGVGVDPRPTDEASGAEARLEARILAEFMDAQIIVVGVPMYNFGVPAQLKSWIDYLSVAGVTFRYTAEGPEGLAGGRRVILASARGGIYLSGTPRAAVEHQESYLQAVFAFFGITDVEVVRAEGVRMGPEAATAAIDAAEAQISALG